MSQGIIYGNDNCFIHVLWFVTDVVDLKIADLISEMIINLKRDICLILLLSKVILKFKSSGYQTILTIVPQPLNVHI